MAKTEEERKKERMYLLLKWMANYEVRSFWDLAKEIWITEPTFREFIKGNYSEKTYKMVESRFFQLVSYLNDQICYYKDVRDDRE